MSLLSEDTKITLSGPFKFAYALIDNSIKAALRYKVATVEDIKVDMDSMMKDTEIDVCLDKDFWLNYFKKFINFNDKSGKFFVEFTFIPPYANPSSIYNTPIFTVALRRHPLRGQHQIDTIMLKFYVLEYQFACWLNEQINWSRPSF